MRETDKLFERFFLLNAAGVMCTTKKELEALLSSDADAIIVKTMTLLPREGNPEPRLYYDSDISINSMGLPNKGVDYYCKLLPDLKKYGKPVFASISGFSEDEFCRLLEKVNKAGFDTIEVNLSCPNVEAKKIFAYDLDLTLKLVEKLRKMTSRPLGLKLPPYTERWQIKKLADGFLKIGVDFITLSNSWPLGCIVDAQKESLVIKPNQGIGGLGGKFFKHIVLGQVRLFYQVFKGRVKIIAVGGVSSGKDVYEYALVGANGVGIGTRLLWEGENVFKRVKKELRTILEDKGVSKIEDKIGKIKKVNS